MEREAGSGGVDFCFHFLTRWVTLSLPGGGLHTQTSAIHGMGAKSFLPAPRIKPQPFPATPKALCGWPLPASPVSPSTPLRLCPAVLVGLCFLEQHTLSPEDLSTCRSLSFNPTQPW